MKIQIDISKNDFLQTVLHIQNKKQFDKILEVFEHTGVFEIPERVVEEFVMDNKQYSSFIPSLVLLAIMKRIDEEEEKKKEMNNIFTICYSEEEANEIGHFIMSKGYEGVQNDSYRYCRECISFYFNRAIDHHRNHIYVGVNSYQMVVSDNKRCLRKRGLKYIEKKRKFYDLLKRY